MNDTTTHTKKTLTVLIGAGIGSFLEFYAYGLIGTIYNRYKVYTYIIYLSNKGYWQRDVAKVFFPPVSNPNIQLLER